MHTDKFDYEELFFNAINSKRENEIPPGWINPSTQLHRMQELQNKIQYASSNKN